MRKRLESLVDEGGRLGDRLREVRRVLDDGLPGAGLTLKGPEVKV